MQQADNQRAAVQSQRKTSQKPRLRMEKPHLTVPSPLQQNSLSFPYLCLKGLPSTKYLSHFKCSDIFRPFFWENVWFLISFPSFSKRLVYLQQVIRSIGKLADSHKITHTHTFTFRGNENPRRHRQAPLATRFHPGNVRGGESSHHRTNMLASCYSK